MRISLPILMLALAAPMTAAAGEAVDPLPAARVDVTRDGFLAQVLDELAHSRSPIAANTLDAIHRGVIALDTLDRMPPADCRALLAENAEEWKGVDPAGCDEGVPAPVLDKVGGFSTEHRVYLRSGVAPRAAAATLVHEVNHIANASNDHYATAEQKLAEEYRAYWVAVVYQDGKAPNAGYLGWLKGWIIENYALSGVTPADLPDRPAGVLDNSM